MLSLEQSMDSQAASDLDPFYAQFRDQSRFWIQRVAVPLLMVIGLFGNLITVIIMTRRGMRSTTNMYLAALAFVDMLYLVLTFILGLSHYPNMANFKYYLYWKLKPFIMMLADACSNTSVWLTVTFTIERYIAVKYPMKGKVWCTEKRAKMLITCVFAFGTLFAAPVPFEWMVIEKTVDQKELLLVPINNTDKEALSITVQNKTMLPSSSPTSITEAITMLAKSSDNDELLLSKFLNDSILEPTETSLNENEKNDKNAINIQAVDTRILALDNTEFGRNEYYRTYYYRSSAVLFCFIPLFSLMLFNGFLIQSVHQSKRERTKMTRRTINRNQPNSRRFSSELTTNETYHRSTSDLDIQVSLNGKNICSNESRTKKRSLPNPSKVKNFRFLSNCFSERRKRKHTPANIDANPIKQEKLNSYPLINESAACPECTESSGSPAKSGVVESSNHHHHNLSPKAQQLTVTNSLQALPLMEEKVNGLMLVKEYTTQVNIHITNESSENYVHINCDSEPLTEIDLNEEELKELKTTNRRPSNVSEQSYGLRKQEEPKIRLGSSSSGVGGGSKPNLSAKFMRSDSVSARLTKSSGKRSLPQPPITSSFGSNNKLNQASPSSSTHQHQQQQAQHITSPASSQERRITIMLISVVILFLFCQIPAATMLLYTSVRETIPNTNEHALVLAFGNIFNFLVAVNAAGNFILYSFLSKKYRRTFMILFCSCLGAKHKQTKSANKRMLSMRAETSSGIHSQKNPSFYQSNNINNNNNNNNINKQSEKFRRDTLV